MEDGLIGLAWLLSLGSALVCIIYGAIKWNNSGDKE